MKNNLVKLASGVLLAAGLVACPTPPAPPPPPPPEAVTTQLLLNGGFEATTTNWTFAGGAGRVVSNNAKSGTAWGSIASASTSTDRKISQLINVPASGNSTLKYSVKITSDEGVDSSFDSLVIRVNSTIINTLTVANTRGAYVEYTYDLSPFKGAEAEISFRGTFDNSVLSTFAIDDVTATNVR